MGDCPMTLPGRRQGAVELWYRFVTKMYVIAAAASAPDVGPLHEKHRLLYKVATDSALLRF